MNELEELNLLNQLIELGAKAAHAHAQSNSDDGHKGTAAWVQWHELRAEMGELVRAAYAPQADSVTAPAYSIDADPQGIRARVAEAITGALAFGARGANPPPPGHWLAPFWKSARQEASRNAPVTSDTLYLLRRLLSNQHTLTGSEFREELGKIVGEATQAADSVLEDAARWQALEACVIEINGGKDWMSIVLKDDAKPEHFLKGLLADKLAALAARKQGGA